MLIKSNSFSSRLERHLIAIYKNKPSKFTILPHIIKEAEKQAKQILVTTIRIRKIVTCDGFLRKYLMPKFTWSMPLFLQTEITYPTAASHFGDGFCSFAPIAVKFTGKKVSNREFCAVPWKALESRSTVAPVGHYAKNLHSRYTSTPTYYTGCCWVKMSIF